MKRAGNDSSRAGAVFGAFVDGFRVSDFENGEAEAGGEICGISVTRGGALHGRGGPMRIFCAGDVVFAAISAGGGAADGGASGDRLVQDHFGSAVRGGGRGNRVHHRSTGARGDGVSGGLVDCAGAASGGNGSGAGDSAEAGQQDFIAAGGVCGGDLRGGMVDPIFNQTADAGFEAG